MFHDGKVAMMVSQQYVAQELRDMTDDWGFVLFPKGPRSKPYRYRSDENMMVIPSTFKSEEVEKILYAFQLWSTPVDDDPDAWKDDQYNIYRDSRAVDETLTMIRNPAYGSMKYYVFIPGLERGDIAWNMWFEGADPDQLVESVSQSWNAIIKKPWEIGLVRFPHGFFHTKQDSCWRDFKTSASASYFFSGRSSRLLKLRTDVFSMEEMPKTPGRYRFFLFPAATMSLPSNKATLRLLRVPCEISRIVFSPPLW